MTEHQRDPSLDWLTGPLPVDRLIRYNVIALGIFGLLAVLYSVAESLYDIVALLGATMVITYLFLSPVHWLERLIRPIVRRFSLGKLRLNARALSILMVYLLVGLMSILIIIPMAPRMVDQVRSMTEEWPAQWHQAEQRVDHWFQWTRWWLKAANDPNSHALEQKVREQTRVLLSEDLSPGLRPKKGESAWSNLPKGIVRQVLGGLVSLGTNMLAAVIYSLTALVLVFYLLMDGQKLKRGLAELAPQRYEARLAAFLDESHKLLYRFIRGQTLMGLLGGTYIFFVYSAFGVKYALILAMIFGVSSIIPVVGPWVGLFPGILEILFSPEPSVVVPVLVLMGGFYIVKEYFVKPRLIGIELKIHPVLLILTFLIGIQLEGILSVLLALPLASVISLAGKFIREHHANNENGLSGSEY